MPSCKNGSRRNRKTGKCINKICPPGKLLNTKTNRCILNNTRNRKKLNIFIDIKKKEKVSKIKKSDVNIFTDKCKSYNNLVSIDLNEVVYVDDMVFKYKNKLLNKSRYLSEGSYGKVYEIYNRNHKIA